MDWKLILAVIALVLCIMGLRFIGAPPTRTQPVAQLTDDNELKQISEQSPYMRNER
jgi:hypothetical protein